MTFWFFMSMKIMVLTKMYRRSRAPMHIAVLPWMASQSRPRWQKRNYTDIMKRFTWLSAVIYLTKITFHWMIHSVTCRHQSCLSNRWWWWCVMLSRIRFWTQIKKGQLVLVLDSRKQLSSQVRRSSIRQTAHKDVGIKLDSQDFPHVWPLTGWYSAKRGLKGAVWWQFQWSL